MQCFFLRLNPILYIVCTSLYLDLKLKLLITNSKFLLILVIPTTVIGTAIILFLKIIVDFFFIVFVPCPSDPIKLYDLQQKPDLLI